MHWNAREHIYAIVSRKFSEFSNTSSQLQSKHWYVFCGLQMEGRFFLAIWTIYRFNNTIKDIHIIITIGFIIISQSFKQNFALTQYSTCQEYWFVQKWCAAVLKIRTHKLMNNLGSSSSTQRLMTIKLIQSWLNATIPLCLHFLPFTIYRFKWWSVPIVFRLLVVQVRGIKLLWHTIKWAYQWRSNIGPHFWLLRKEDAHIQY